MLDKLRDDLFHAARHHRACERHHDDAVGVAGHVLEHVQAARERPSLERATSELSQEIIDTRDVAWRQRRNLLLEVLLLRKLYFPHDGVPLLAGGSDADGAFSTRKLASQKL